MSDQEDKLQGLGGWLILVAAGLILSEIIWLKNFFEFLTPLYMDDGWSKLTSPDSMNYDSAWLPLIIWNLTYMFIIICANTALIYLFFSKNYIFPKAYIITAGIAIIFIPINSWLLTFPCPYEPTFDSDTVRDLGRGLVSACIWFPYMLLSKRVKNTFVKKSDATDLLV